MRRVFALSFAALVLSLFIGPEGLLRAQQAPRVTIEDPSGRVLPALRARLEEASSRLVRLSFWGGSHTASDQYTGALRRRLQQRLGDGGTGLFFPAPPMMFYERRDVTLESARGFTGVHALRATTPLPLGSSGMALDARGEAMARFRLRHGIEGTVRVFVENVGSEEGSVTLTAGPLRETRTVAAGARVELSSPLTSRPSTTFTLHASHVRVLGISAENGRGVVVENFGVSGARAERAHHWESASFDAQLDALAPDVAFLAYGTNESIGRRPIEDERRALEALITRIRARAPRLVCVVMGPSNYPLQRGGRWTVNPRNSLIREAFRAAAFAQGCGFVDLIAFQGGPSNLEAWVSEGRVLDDHVHMTDAAHEELARALVETMLGRSRSEE